MVTAPVVQTPEPRGHQVQVCRGTTSPPGTKKQHAVPCPLSRERWQGSQGTLSPCRVPGAHPGMRWPKIRVGTWGGCGAPAAGRGRLSLARRWLFWVPACSLLLRQGKSLRPQGAGELHAARAVPGGRGGGGGRTLVASPQPCPGVGGRVLCPPTWVRPPQGPSSQAPQFAPSGVLGFLGAHAAGSHLRWER